MSKLNSQCKSSYADLLVSMAAEGNASLIGQSVPMGQWKIFRLRSEACFRIRKLHP